MTDQLSRATRAMPKKANVPTPRPMFNAPTHIPSHSAALHLWGDDEAGHVADWIYASTQKVHHLVFSVAPGRAFRHSEDFRTIFAADEWLYVLSGTMVIVNPECGEVRRVRQGESVYFRRDTWHHAFSFDDDALKVLEFFAPPPAAGSSSTYARAQPYLAASKYDDDRWRGRWPESRVDREAVATLHVLQDDDALWALDGDRAMIGTQVSTDHLTAGFIDMRPAGITMARSHGGDGALHVISGDPFVLIESVDGGPVDGPRWFHLHPGDGFFLPEGCEYALHNVNGHPAKIAFAVAPAWSPTSIRASEGDHR